MSSCHLSPEASEHPQKEQGRCCMACLVSDMPLMSDDTLALHSRGPMGSTALSSQVAKRSSTAYGVQNWLDATL